MRSAVLAGSRGLTLALFLVAAPIVCGAQTVSVHAAVAVGPQYDSTHVYVSEDDIDAFVVSFLATFGGTASRKIALTITPTPSKTFWRFITSPVGTLSVFAFTTPIPYPFGSERTGYLVSDMDEAITAALGAGADVIVQPFSDPVGRDAVIEWPGGVRMQIYWHTTAPHYAALATTPENRVYVSSYRADAFVRGFLAFSHGRVTSDRKSAPGVEIGSPGETYRRIRISSQFGKLVVLVTDGHLPYPYGRETMGYEVLNLPETLSKATAAGATILVAPYVSEGRTAAVLRFPGGYITEVHADP